MTEIFGYAAVCKQPSAHRPNLSRPIPTASNNCNFDERLVGLSFKEFGVFMFSAAIQPSIVSVFSSTGTDPLQLFSAHTDAALASDSCIHSLHDRKSLPLPPAPAVIISPPPVSQTNGDDDSDHSGYELDQTVLQIQSPTLKSTYIQCPPSGSYRNVRRSSSGARDKSRDLAIKHPWMHLQVRNMGREWSFEVGLVDQSGRMGIVRLSTFQKQPRLKVSGRAHSYPLLHLPLSFPPSSSRPLTAWSTITLCLSSYLPYFSSPILLGRGGDDDEQQLNVRGLRSNMSGDIPTGPYSHVAYIRVYATCRLRRIWFSEAGPDQRTPWEFELYGGNA